MSVNVLVADHDPARLEELSGRLEADGYEVIRAASTCDALHFARTLRPGAVVLELGSEAAHGLAALDELVDLEDAPSVVLVAEAADVSTAVAAMRRGAESFLLRPIEHDVLAKVLLRALTSRTVAIPPPDSLGEPALIARSPSMQRVLAQIDRIAASANATVLIQGESGTGKELLARRIHARSSRSRAPFVSILCSALSEPRPGSEPSFGSLAGANGGTLFFDEVGELPPVLQAKLTGILGEESFRAGALDVRIVASTTRDLEASVAEGRFRADLFYRLNVLGIRVPSLRERVHDVPALAAHFLCVAEEALGRRFEGFTDAALERLARHPWPGNVRELRNAIVRAATLESSPRIRPLHLGLPAHSARPRAGDEDAGHSDTIAPADSTLRAVEQTHILRVLRESHGNRSRAARLLGVNRTTLYGKLRRYGIDA